MNSKEEKLASLEAEQRILQFGSGQPTDRDRGFDEYSLEFDMPSSWLRIQINEMLRSLDRISYVDLGCGNGIAVRQAALAAFRIGKSFFHAHGVDVLDRDGTPNFLEAMIKVNSSFYPKDLLNPLLNISFHKADIDDFVFPQKADLVTICHALMHTRDPLQTVINAAAQTERGGIICFNNLPRIHGVKESLHGSLFDKVFGLKGGLSGFSTIKQTCDALIIRKNDEQAWFGGLPKLVERYKVPRDVGYHFLYSLPL